MAVEEVSGCWRRNKNDLLHCRAVKVLEQESADPAFSFSTNWCWDGGQAFACLRPQFPVGSSGKVGLQDSKGSICSKCLIYGYVLALVFRAINSRFIFLPNFSHWAQRELTLALFLMPETFPLRWRSEMFHCSY